MLGHRRCIPMPPVLSAPGRASDGVASRGRVVCARAARLEFLRACARLVFLAYPLPPFSRRRKEGPTPVLLSKRRRRVSRGGYAPLPREPLLGQFPGRAIVEAVVRRLAHGDQVPAAPLPSGEVLDRIDVMRGDCLLAPAVPQRFLAQRLLAQHTGAEDFPTFALVIHGIKNRRSPSMGDRRCAVRLSPRM